MATEIGVINRALQRIGIDAFIADREEQSREAGVCNAIFDDVRDEVLAAFPWPFATRRFRLNLKADEATRDGWKNVFACPPDMITPQYIWPQGVTSMAVFTPPIYYGANAGYWANPRTPRSDQRQPYALEASSVDDSPVILCDLDTPTLVYTSRIEDPVKWFPLFASAMAWLLAAEIVMPLTIKPDLEKMCRERFMMTIREAEARAFQGDQEDIQPDAEWIAGRL